MGATYAMYACITCIGNQVKRTWKCKRFNVCRGRQGKILEYVGVTKKQPSDQPIKLELRNKEIQEYFENNGWPRFRSRILSITIKMTFTMFETNIALPEYASVIPAKKSKIQRAILSEFRMTIVSDIPRVKRGRNHFRCMD